MNPIGDRNERGRSLSTAMQPGTRFETVALVFSTVDSASIVECKRSKILTYAYRSPVPQERQAGR